MSLCTERCVGEVLEIGVLRLRQISGMSAADAWLCASLVLQRERVA